jgi:hypothetical protein
MWGCVPRVPLRIRLERVLVLKTRPKCFWGSFIELDPPDGEPRANVLGPFESIEDCRRFAEEWNLETEREVAQPALC